MENILLETWHIIDGGWVYIQQVEENGWVKYYIDGIEQGFAKIDENGNVSQYKTTIN